MPPNATPAQIVFDLSAGLFAILIEVDLRFQDLFHGLGNSHDHIVVGIWRDLRRFIGPIENIIEQAFEAKRPVVTYPLEMDVNDFERADMIIMWLLRGLPRVHNFLGVTKSGEEYRAIVQYIDKHGGKASDTAISSPTAIYCAAPALRRRSTGPNLWVARPRPS